MAKTTYASLTPRNKDLIDLVEGMDNGKNVREFCADVSYTVGEGKQAETKSGTIFLSESVCKGIRREYRYGFDAAIAAAETYVSGAIGREEDDTKVAIVNIKWLNTALVVADIVPNER